MNLVKRILFTVLLLAAMGSWALAQTDQGAGQDMKDAGHATKSAGKSVGHATKKTAKRAGHGVKKGTHKAAHKTAQGANKVDEKTTPQ
jgi:predicted small secreted protein